MRAKIYYNILFLLSGLYMYAEELESPKIVKIIEENSSQAIILEIAANKLEKDRVVLTEEDIQDLERADTTQVYLSEEFLNGLSLISEKLGDKLYPLTESLEIINKILHEKKRIVNQEVAEQSVKDIRSIIEHNKSYYEEELYNKILKICDNYEEDLANQSADIRLEKDEVTRRRKAYCNLFVRDTLKVGNALYVCGNECIQGQLTVNNASNFNGPVTINFPQRRRAGIDALTVVGTSEFIGSVNIAGNLHVGGIVNAPNSPSGIYNGSITTSELADGSVTFPKLNSSVYSVAAVPNTLVLRDSGASIFAATGTFSNVVATGTITSDSASYNNIALSATGGQIYKDVSGVLVPFIYNYPNVESGNVFSGINVGNKTLVNAPLITAMGGNALRNVTTGGYNTASGYQALFKVTTGTDNIGIGYQAGIHLIDGSSNVYIGSPGNPTDSSEDCSVRIGCDPVVLDGCRSRSRCFIAGIFKPTRAASPRATVTVDADGIVNTDPIPSSRRYKENIQKIDLEKAHDIILKLELAAFNYKSDKLKREELGLIAEDVEKIAPELVIYNEQGEIESVKYDCVAMMLLAALKHRQHKMKDLVGEIKQLKVKLN